MSQPSFALNIECTLKRKGGSQIQMADGTNYHFAPDPLDRHTAVVSNAAHIARFLSMPEAYRALGPAELDMAATGSAIGALNIAVTQPAAQPAEIAAAAAAELTTAPADASEKALADAMRDHSTNDTGSEITPPERSDGADDDAQGTDGDLSNLDADALKALFEEELGRKPHPASKIATMIEQIKAQRAAKVAA